MLRLVPCLALLLWMLPAVSAHAEWTADAKACFSKKGDSAIAACDRALASGQLSNEERAWTLNNRGVEYRAKGSHDRALRDYDEAIRLKPDYADAFYNRGLAYNDQGSYDRAIRDYNAAIHLKPDDAATFNNRGHAYELKGDLIRAGQDYRRALELDPSYERAKNNLADLESKLTGSPSPGFDPELIRRTQAALNGLGYGAGPVDGAIGRRTRDAVAAFRRDQGMGGGDEVDEALVERLESLQQAKAEAERRRVAEAEQRRAAEAAEQQRLQRAAEAARRAEEERRAAEAARQTAERGPRAPVLTLPTTLQTDRAATQLTGTVTDDRPGVTLTYRGQPVPIAPDGSFTLRIYAPLGESWHELVAVDAAGQQVKALVVVTRVEPVPEAEVLAALDPLRAEWTAQPERLALVIGIEDYERLPDVAYAQNDARAFRDYAELALGVPARAVLLLDEPGETGRTALLTAIRQQVLPRVRAGAREVVVYYAGHGLADAAGRLFLLPRDAVPEPEQLEEVALAQDQLRDQLIQAGARSVLFLLDTCFSGAGRDVAELAPGRRFALGPVLEQPEASVTLLAASSGSGPSHGLDAVRHGAFSYFLMKGLEGEADADQDDALTAAELQAFLLARVPAAVAGEGRSQTPTLSGNAALVLARR